MTASESGPQRSQGLGTHLGQSGTSLAPITDVCAVGSLQPRQAWNQPLMTCKQWRVGEGGEGGRAGTVTRGRHQVPLWAQCGEREWRAAARRWHAAAHACRARRCAVSWSPPPLFHVPPPAPGRTKRVPLMYLSTTTGPSTSLPLHSKSSEATSCSASGCAQQSSPAVAAGGAAACAGGALGGAAAGTAAGPKLEAESDVNALQTSIMLPLSLPLSVRGTLVLEPRFCGWEREQRMSGAGRAWRGGPPRRSRTRARRDAAAQTGPRRGKCTPQMPPPPALDDLTYHPGVPGMAKLRLFLPRPGGAGATDRSRWGRLTHAPMPWLDNRGFLGHWSSGSAIEAP
jgi:hypothetical protein